MLALLIGTILRYSETGTYDFDSAYHIPTFLFLGLIVAMFLGLTNSADDIIRDRPVLQRERNIKVRLSYYVISKTITLGFFALIQCVLFVLIGNFVLQIRGMLQLDMRSLASYPTAVAAMLVCAAIFSLKVYQQPETARVATQSPLTLSVPVNADQEWNLASPVSTQIFRTQPLRSFRESAQTHRAAPPRYVLDSVPVSYEPTFRF